MARLVYGKTNLLRFSNDSEFFETLGFLVNQNRTEIYWEANELTGAWGSEGRIHCLTDLNSFPAALQSKFTAGIGNVLHRINCNDYIIELVNNWGFQPQSRTGLTTERIIAPNYTTALALVQASAPQFIADFDRGYNT